VGGAGFHGGGGGGGGSSEKHDGGCISRVYVDDISEGGVVLVDNGWSELKMYLL
jgi:hypothetical protein